MCGHKMPVSGEESETEMASENGEPTAPEESAQEFAFKNKYKELKGRLKYLVYEQECYESELYRAEQTLLELSKDKSFLLDQLLRYEPVRDEEEELTDESSSEEETMNTSFEAVPIIQQPSPLTSSHGAAVKSSGVPSSQTSTVVVPKPSDNTKRGIAKAKAILNSVASKASKGHGARRQGKGTRISSGAVDKITKTVARARYSKNSHGTKLIVSSIPVSQPLVVSLPLHLASVAKSQANAQTPPSSAVISATAAIAQNSLVVTTTSSSSTSVGNVGGVLVSTVSSSQDVPVMATGATAVGAGAEGRQRLSSSSSTSSSSSSSSDSEDSASESGSSSPEGMEVGGALPIIMSSAAKSDGLPKPKAITSPIKTVPPTALVQTSSSPVPVLPPPLLSPLTSPRLGHAGMTSTAESPGFTWTKPSGSMSSGNSSNAGFMPIAPPLTSPPSSLPFSLLSKQPGSANSAFQVVSTKSSTSPNSSHARLESSQTAIIRTTET